MKSYNNTKFQGKKIETKLPENMVDDALYLVADLIGDPNAHQIAKFALRPNMLPDDMRFEATILRLICEMSSQNILPTEWTLAERLKYDYKDARERLVSFMNRYRSNPPMPRVHAFNLGDWIERRNMLEAAVRIQQVFAANIGLSRDAYAEAMEIMLQVAPRLASAESQNAVDTLREFKEDHTRRHQNFLDGIKPGPATPWEALNKHTGYHIEGDMWSWMAKSKHGKSTIAFQLAYYILFNHCDDPMPYDIGYFHLETTRMDIERRWVASQIDLPLTEMDTIPVLTHAGTRNAFERIEKKVVEVSQKAELEYIFCPGIGFAELVTTMADRKARSAARGRKYVAIIDYYQEIDGSAFSIQETEKYNRMATELKNAFQSLCIYGHVFSQYNIDSDYSTKMTSFNGSKLQMRSQVVIRVEREYDTKNNHTQDTPAYYADGQLAKDTLGNTIYFQRAGNVSSKATFNVLMANGDGGGNPGSVDMMFVNALYQIHPVHELKAKGGMSFYAIPRNPNREPEKLPQQKRLPVT
jgi:hypothetical protein